MFFFWGCHIYTLKTNSDGTEKFKARFIAKRYNIKQGIDYEEMFSPTAAMTSVRILMQKENFF